MPVEALSSLLRLALPLALAAAGPEMPAHPGGDDDDDSAAEEVGPAGGTVRGTIPVGKAGEPTVVYLKDVAGDYAPRVRLVEIKGGLLGARVVTVAVGDTVKFVNQDAQPHTVASTDSGGYDLGLLDKGEARGQVFLRPGAYAQRCQVHKELLGWIYVAPSPHAAVADKAGAYEIRDVPPGRFTVGAWSPGAKLADGVAVVAGEAGAVAVSAAPVVARPAAPRPGRARPAQKEKGRSDLGTIRGKVEAEPAKYLDETIVYLKNAQGIYQPKVHVMDQRKMRFIPHMLTITQGDTVRFLNNDGLAHNVYSNDGEAYNLGMFPDGEERPYTFMRAGTYAQLCNIHPEMLAYVFVGQNPYSAIVDKSGRYEIRNVPPGQYTLAVWNSHLKGPEKSVSVDLGRTIDAHFTLRR